VIQPRKPHLVVVGAPPTEIVEGGGSRIAQLIARLEVLPASISYVEPAVVTAGRTFVAHAARSRLAARLLDPSRRHFVISVGYGMSPRVVRLLRSRCALLYFDVHDEPTRQYRDLQIRRREGEDVRGKSRLLESCIAAFEYVGFAAPGLADLYPRRPGHMVVPNAADPAHFTVGDPPEGETVALVGSTSAGRGAGTLIEACRIARRQFTRLRLRLALNDTGGRGDLAELRARYGDTPWISFESIGYAELPEFLRQASVCVIPHPRTEYTDIVLPLKLFDYMAAGRPVVTTDCKTTAEIVTRNEAGLVCSPDPADIAGAIGRLLGDRPLASALGRRGRRAIETVHNWQRAFEPALLAIRERLGRDGE
jgi:glycosyltransferase involved in cell wall biosynthesis